MNTIKEMFERLIFWVGGCISKYSFSRMLVYLIMLAAAAVGIEYCIIAAFRGMRRAHRSGGDRVVAAVSVLQTLSGMGVALIIVLSGLWISGMPVALGSAEPEPVNREELVRLEASNWARMGTEERVETLQLLVDVEREKLGISEKLVVTAEDLEGKNGEYNELRGLIRIDLDHLENSPEWRVIETACHEVYHCYEHRLVEIYMGASSKNRNLRIFDKAKQYQWEERHYITSEGERAEAFYEYYDQELEKDARAYATMTAPEYYPWMEGRVPEEELSQ